MHKFLLSKSRDKDIKYGPDKFKVYISLPYLGETSEKIRGNINSCLSRMKCGKFV